MRIYYSVFLKLVGTIFFTWFGLMLAGLIGLNFSLDLNLFFWVFIVALMFFLSLELTKNRKIVYQLLRSYKEKVNKEFVNKVEVIQENITSFSPFFNSKIGGNFAYFLAYIFSFLYGIYVFFKKYVFWRYNLLVFFLIEIWIGTFKDTSFSDLKALALFGLWFIIIRAFNFKAETSIIVAVALLSLSPFLLILGKEPIAEKAALWAYGFLLVGVLQKLNRFSKDERV